LVNRVVQDGRGCFLFLLKRWFMLL